MSAWRSVGKSALPWESSGMRILEVTMPVEEEQALTKESVPVE